MDNKSKRIAIITDVHGNLTALKAVFEKIKMLDCDKIYHLGDAIGMGPDPQPCLEILLGTKNVHMIMGNHDAYFTHGFTEDQLQAMDDLERAHHLWIHEQIHPIFKGMMKDIPYAIEESFFDTKVTFLHYATRKGKGCFKPICQKDEVACLDALFEDTAGDIIFYGHHHPFSDCMGRVRYINPGSLGCSGDAFGRFTFVEFNEAGYRVDHIKVPYDLGAVYEAFEEKHVPGRKFVLKAFFGKED